MKVSERQIDVLLGVHFDWPPTRRGAAHLLRVIAPKSFAAHGMQDCREHTIDDTLTPLLRLRGTQ